MIRKIECAVTDNIVSPLDLADLNKEILKKCSFEILQKTAQVSHLWKTFSIEIYKKSCNSELENYIKTLRVKLTDPEEFIKQNDFFEESSHKNIFAKCDSLNRLFYNRALLREEFVYELSDAYRYEEFENVIYDDDNSDEYSSDEKTENTFWKKPWNWGNFYRPENLFEIDTLIVSYYDAYDRVEIESYDDHIDGLIIRKLFNKAFDVIDKIECNAEKNRYVKKIFDELYDRGLDFIELSIYDRMKNNVDGMGLAELEFNFKMRMKQRKS